MIGDDTRLRHRVCSPFWSADSAKLLLPSLGGKDAERPMRHKDVAHASTALGLLNLRISWKLDLEDLRARSQRLRAEGEGDQEQGQHELPSQTS